MNATPTLYSFITVRVRRGDRGWVASFRSRWKRCAWSDAQAVRDLAKHLGYPPSTDVVRVGPASDGDGEVWKIQEVGNADV